MHLLKTQYNPLESFSIIKSKEKDDIKHCTDKLTAPGTDDQAGKDNLQEIYFFNTL